MSVINWKSQASIDADRAEALAESVRAERDRRLWEADCLIERATDQGDDTTALRTYRQALRDVPQQTGFPDTVQWPELPSL